MSGQVWTFSRFSFTHYFLHFSVVWINSSLFYLTVAGDDLNELVKNTVDGAKGLTDQASQLIKDGVDSVHAHINGANMVQISSMGLLMTVLAIFNR